MVNKSLLGFVYDQYQKPPPVLREDLSGKTVVVVGANAGIGYEATKHFAEMNPGRLIMVCRNEEKGKNAVSKLQETTGYKAELWLMDLSSFASVKAFINKFNKECDRLDILVENAAIVEGFTNTADGWEILLQVNYISIALHSILLIPKMMKTLHEHATQPRLVIVSSDMHYFAGVDAKLMDSQNMLQEINTYDESLKSGASRAAMNARYSVSKLLDVFLALSLNAHLPKTTPTIIVNSLNPGFCYSELRRGDQSWGNVILEKCLAITAEAGSRQIIYAALGKDQSGGVDGMRGAYVGLFSKVSEPSDYVLSEDGKKFQERLWKELIEVLKGVDANVGGVVEQYLSG